MTEWHASDYSHESSLQKELAEKQLARLTLKGNEQILDVGCGDGKITAEIAARVPNGSVLGVDPSSDMIAFATKHFGPPNIKNLRFEVADVRKLKFQNEFDLVVSFNALHWVPEQAQALNSIRAALKPTGRAVLRFVPQGQRTCLEDVIEQTRQSARWSKFFTNFRCPYAHFTPDEYRSLGRAVPDSKSSSCTSKKAPGISKPATASSPSPGQPSPNGPSACRRPSGTPSSPTCWTATKKSPPTTRKNTHLQVLPAGSRAHARIGLESTICPGTLPFRRSRRQPDGGRRR